MGTPLVGDASLLMVSHSSGDGSSQSTPHLSVHCMLMGRGAACENGASFVAARRRKERSSWELVRLGRRARLVVLAGEIRSRSFAETKRS